MKVNLLRHRLGKCPASADKDEALRHIWTALCLAPENPTAAKDLIDKAVWRLSRAARIGDGSHERTVSADQ